IGFRRASRNLYGFQKVRVRIGIGGALGTWSQGIRATPTSEITKPMPGRGRPCRGPERAVAMGLESLVMTSGVAGPAALAALGVMLLVAAARAENDRAAADRYAVPGLQKPATIRIDQSA